MSLQVWLPLNGDLHNQGLSNINIIDHEVTINNEGKIGKCYEFKSGSYLSSSSIINFNSNIISIAGWAKFSSSDAGSGYLFGVSNSTSPTFMLWRKSSELRYYANKTSQGTIDISNYQNDWHHYTFTSNGTIIKVYIDGVLVKEKKVSIDVLGEQYVFVGARHSNDDKGGAIFYNGFLNDIRIYDHCLSVKEVEEISKGLVLHYKLDNIINNIVYDCSGYNHNGSIIGSFNFNNTSARYKNSIMMNNINTANHIECNDIINLPINGITVSFWAYTEKTSSYVLYIDQNMSFAVNSSGGGFYVSRASSAGFPMTEFKINQWNHVVLIRNGDTYKAYINGKNIPRSQSNNNWTHQVSNIYLFNRKYNNNYAANASISDFRMYATELTEKQILELYNTSMTIDNIGNGYSRDIIEDNLLNIDKQGIFHNSKLSDSNENIIASITKSKELKVNNFYEY